RRSAGLPDRRDQAAGHREDAPAGAGGDGEWSRQQRLSDEDRPEGAGRRSYSHDGRLRGLPAGSERSDSYRAVPRGGQGPFSRIEETVGVGVQASGAREGCVMVKVGSMRRKRILLIASLLLLTAGASSASWRRKGDRPAEAAAPAAMTLTAIETESAPTARLILRTSGTPAYTSYSPTPDTFVIDLSGASKAPSLTIPSLLPPSITSVTAEEVTEMGTRVMRVTVHLAQPAALQ